MRIPQHGKDREREESGMATRAESIRVMHPLFNQAGQGGSIPTSALDLWFCKIDRGLADDLCRLWHSTLPDTGGGGQRVCYGATHGSLYYAAAIWTNPSSPKLPQLEWIQLSRFAIADDSVKNHASRMLAWMRRDIRKRFPEVKIVVSYQDCVRHMGTIYKADGWGEGIEEVRSPGTTWANRQRENQVDGKPEVVKRWIRSIIGPRNYKSASELDREDHEDR